MKHLIDPSLDRKSAPCRLRMALSVMVLVAFGSCSPAGRDDTARSRHYAYDEQEVQYRNDSAGITLAGTLAIPRGRRPAPAVILVANGVCDRDFTSGRHRSFRVLSDHLARRGLAVLRSDGRGVGQSEGQPWPAYTKEDLASDVKAALHWLRNRPEIDESRIGLLGHSEGGTVATLAATKAGGVDFLVLLSSPGLRGGEVLSSQITSVAPTFGVEPVTAAKHAHLVQRTTQILLSGRDEDAVRSELERIFRSYLDSTTATERESLKRSGYSAPDSPTAYATGVLLPWMKDFLVYDPGLALKQVRCPVLSIIGTRDLQVSAEENSEAIRAALAVGGNSDFTVTRLRGLNHLLQSASTGSPAEYERIEETMSPVALDTISGWISKHAAH
jgi:pimeloyl-ACP methyl ester carboxylesterase